MIKNITRRIDELQDVMDRYGPTLSEADRAKYLREINEMKKTLRLVEQQCSQLAEGDYDSEKRELRFIMKNTTRLHFRELGFTLIAGGEKIPVVITDWRPGEKKTIRIYHDFNDDWHYKTMNVIRLKNHADSVEYALYDPSAARNTGLEGGETRKRPTGYSEKQGYLVSIRSFCEKVTQLDLRAKARRLEGLIIDIFDIMSARPELRTRTRKFMVVYLPMVNRALAEYQKAASGNGSEADLVAFAERTHETLDLALTAFRKLKEKLNDGEIEESEVDLEIMKRFMKEEGLL